MRSAVIEKNTAQVSSLMKQITRQGDFDPKDITEAVKIILNGKIKNKDIFMGSLFSSLMMIDDPDKKFQAAVACLSTCLQMDSFPDKPKITINKPVYSICGSGKDDVKLFNVSTMASIVASVAGVCVGKNGAPATSSMVGSSDFFELIGLNYEKATIRKMAKGLEELGYGFFAVQKIVPKLFQAYDSSFYYPTILSYGLLALVTPIELTGIVYGVSDPDIETAARVLSYFGYRNSIVLCGEGTNNGVYMDEASIIGETRMVRIDDHGLVGPIATISPSDFGITNVKKSNIIESKNPLENYKRALRILGGKGNKGEKEIIALNAGILIYLANCTSSMQEGYKKARQILDGEKPLTLLRDFARYHNLTKI